MEDKEFDKLTPEEKKARFQKAVDDYNSGFVEVDYVFRSVASIRVEEAMEDAGRVSEEFKPAQIKVIYEAAKADLNLEHYMNPKFSASHMKFIILERYSTLPLESKRSYSMSSSSIFRSSSKFFMSQIIEFSDSP